VTELAIDTRPAAAAGSRCRSVALLLLLESVGQLAGAAAAR
jgi:hypothetical protein